MMTFAHSWPTASQWPAGLQCGPVRHTAPPKARQALKTGLGPLTSPVPAARGWAGLMFTLRTSIVLLRY